MLSFTVLRNISWPLGCFAPKINRVSTLRFKPNRGTGDKGESSLFTGERSAKSSAVFEALGATDELNSWIGRIRCGFYEKGHFPISEQLLQIQCCLQDLQSSLATPSKSAKERQLKRTRFSEQFVDEVNGQIDLFAEKVPPLDKFILPGGSDLACQTQIARTVCRRAERRLVQLLKETGDVEPTCLRYLNRLSDLLFMLARYETHASGGEEMAYKKPRTSTSV